MFSRKSSQVTGSIHWAGDVFKEIIPDYRFNALGPYGSNNRVVIL